MEKAPETDGRRRIIAEAAVWLLFCAGAVCVAVLGLLSVGRLRSPVEIGRSYPALVVAQAFFLFLVWPIFRGAGEPEGEPPGRSVLGLLARLVGLLVLAAPIAVVAMRTADVTAGQVLWSQAFVFLLGVVAGAGCRLPGAKLWYYPAALFLAGIAPFLAYLLREEGDLSMRWAGLISPIWAAGSVAAGGEVLWRMVVFGGLAAAAVLVWLWRLRRTAGPDHA